VASKKTGSEVVMAVSRTTGTKADRDQVRQTLAGFGATPATIATELQRRFGLRPRDAFRQAHGWTQDVVAAHLNAAGTGSATFTGARISDYERWPFGGRRPTLAALTALAEAFGTTPACLVDLDDLAAMPDADRAVLHTASIAAAGPASPPVISARLAGDTGGGMRWDLGGLLDETELVIAVTERTAGFGAWAESSNVGPMTLDDIASSTRRVAVDYLTHPPVVVYARAGLLADRVFRLLQTGRQRPDQARELYTWAGYLCTLLAWMAGDLGHPAAAESQARTAWMCAELADDDTLRAWVLSTTSKIYLWDQRYEDAAAAAARGLSHTPSGTAAVMLACQEADAWAEIGAKEPARAALTHAQEARQNAGVDPVGGLLACGTIRQHNYAGSVLLRTGNPADAIDHADQALVEAAGDPAVAYGTIAQIRIWAATAHLSDGSIDGAAEVLAPVLILPAEQRLDTLVRRLRDVGRLLAARPDLRSSIQGRTLHVAVTEFCAVGAARQLPA
jgi:transcriptional regulator with XRE-family HTH domain/tetratricopeptide (TPR) repeat protein